MVDYGRGRHTWGHWSATELIAATLATIGCMPLPLLLFCRLRNLAKRARSAHLAEHCMIVGAGASLSLLYVAFVWVLTTNGDEWFGTWWTGRSQVLLVLELILGVLACLFFLWAVYLLVRFSIAFWMAGRKLRRKWREADRSRDGAIA